MKNYLNNEREEHLNFHGNDYTLKNLNYNPEIRRWINIIDRFD